MATSSLQGSARLPYLWWPLAALSMAFGFLALRAALLADVGALPVGYAARPFTFQLHMALGGMALALGPWQFRTGASQGTARMAHRVLGRMYVLACFISAGSALVLSYHLTAFGLAAQVAFGLLGVLWIATTARAIERVLRRQFVAHRAWMVRSFALTFAAVTLRLYLLVGERALGLPYQELYAVSAWLCWVPNLLVAEWWLRRGPR